MIAYETVLTSLFTSTKGTMIRKMSLIAILSIAAFMAAGSIADDVVVPPPARQIILKLTPKERAARAEFNKAMLNDRA